MANALIEKIEYRLQRDFPFLFKPYWLLRNFYWKIKRLIAGISKKTVVGVSAKEFCLKEEFIFSEEKFLMPELKDVFGQRHKNFSGYEKIIPPFYVRSFKNGICRTNREEVFVSPNQVITEYTTQKINSALGTKFLKPSEIKRIKGTAAHLSLSGLENNYFNWLIECLGRLYLIEKSGFKPDYYIISTKTTFQKQYLELLGINNKNIIPAESEQLIQVDELIVPTFINNWEYINYRGWQHWQIQYLPKWIGNLYKERILPNIRTTEKKRIYMSRRDAGHRKIINEEEVVDVLNHYGFETVHTENMNAIDEVELFANTEIIVSLFSSGLANMLFCPPKMKVLVIYPKDFHDAGARVLANALGVSYNYLIEKGVDASVHPQVENVFVDINKFREALSVLI